MVSIQIAALMLAATGAGETILYDFQADYCGPCKMMEPVVRQLAAEGYPVRQVDVQRDPALAQRYRVTNIPCFVLVVNGQERGRLVGATGYNQLVGLFRSAGVNRPGEDVREMRGQSPDRPRRLLPFSGIRRGHSGQPPAGPRPPRVDLGQPAPSPITSTPPVPTRPSPTPSFDLAALGSAPAPSPAGQQRLTLAQRLLQSSVRLKIQDPDGFSFGSGTIIDYRPNRDGRGGEALVLTCGHIFRDSQGQGAIQADLFDRGQPQSVNGRMIRYDLQRDIGLIAIRTDRPVPVVPLASADPKPVSGEAVISIGCDHGRPPTVQESKITAINSFVGPPNLQVAGQPAVGRSGGGLFNRQGQLIGVCNFADPTDRAGLYAAVEVAHALLQQSGRSGEMLADRGSTSNGGPSAAPAAVIPSRAATDLVALASASPKSGGSNELICIVRNGQDSRHQVIVIDNASEELLRRIAAERQQRRGAFPTSMEVTDGKILPAVRERGVIRTTTDWQPNWR